MRNIEGDINSKLYKTIFDDNLEKSIIDDMCQKLKLHRNQQVILQQGNDSKHTSKLMKEHFKTKDYEVMPWPPQVPDLHLIENMWRLLKIRLNEYDTPPKGINDLFERTQEIFYGKITVEEFQKVSSSMPNCLKTCIKPKGCGIDH